MIIMYRPVLVASILLLISSSAFANSSYLSACVSFSSSAEQMMTCNTQKSLFSQRLGFASIGGERPTGSKYFMLKQTFSPKWMAITLDLEPTQMWENLVVAELMILSAVVLGKYDVVSSTPTYVGDSSIAWNGFNMTRSDGNFIFLFFERQIAVYVATLISLIGLIFCIVRLLLWSR